MSKVLAGILCVGLSVCLAGCDSMTKQDVGVLTGGAVGGLVGSRFGQGSGQVVAAVVGTVAGALVGGAIGKSMDKADQTQVTQALETTPTHRTKEWKNPDNGTVYEVTPTRTYQTRQGRYCREYTTEAVVAGKKQTVYGKACRQADGSWKVVG